MSSPVSLEGARRRSHEIAGIILTAFAVLCLVSLHSEAAGSVGRLLESALRYACGNLAPIPPLFLAILGLSLLRRFSPAGRGRRAVATLLIYCAASGFIHLRWGEPFPLSVSSLWLWRVETGGAGLIGAAVGETLRGAFGENGSVVVVAAAVLIGIVLYVETPLTRLLSGIGNWSAKLVSALFMGGWGFVSGLADEVRDLAASLRDRRRLARAERRLQGPRWTWRSLLRLLLRGRPPAVLDRERPAAAGPSAEGISTAVQTAAEFGKKAAAPKAGRKRPVSESTAQSAPGRTKDAAQEAVSPNGALGGLKDGGSEDRPQGGFELPATALLTRPTSSRGRKGKEPSDQSEALEETLRTFGIESRVVDVRHGPVVTRYELQPAPGIKVSRITGLADDLALSLAAADVRIEAPVPGKSVVGIEVPNDQTETVYLRELIESADFNEGEGRLRVALGKDIAGKPVVVDLASLPHLLIAGATGSGKSVCINTIIVSLLYQGLPDQIKLLMVDPKRVELAVYDGIPHLVAPVVTDPKQASGALRWAVREMERRYQLLSEAGVRNIDGYNRWVEKRLAAAPAESATDGKPSEGDVDGGEQLEPLPYMVVIIDELADLMLVAQHDVEDAICRLAQMARAAGIHLVIATQRPSVDVITGLIKANIPSRVSFQVTSAVDSRTILDMAGAERLLGKGDMLISTGGAKPYRAQGAWVSDKEVQALVDFWKRQGEPVYQEGVLQTTKEGGGVEEADDELFDDAVRLVLETGSASISMIQRRFRVGYARAARLIDMMEQRGIVGPYQGSKPRELLKTLDDLNLSE